MTCRLTPAASDKEIKILSIQVAQDLLLKPRQARNLVNSNTVG